LHLIEIPGHQPALDDKRLLDERGADTLKGFQRNGRYVIIVDLDQDARDLAETHVEVAVSHQGSGGLK
jgi:hypothetical protein